MKEITATDAAKVIGCTVSNVYHLLRSGTVKGRKVSPKMWLVKVSSATAYSKIKQTRGRPRVKNPKPILRKR
jgi:hypothetical protein